MDAVVVAAGPLLVVGILLYVNARRNLEEVKKNWVVYRCNPMYMPFASMFSETSTFENFSSCVSLMSKEVFARATDPIYRMFDMFAGALKGVLDSNNQFRSFLAGISNFLFSFASVVFGKLVNSFSTLTFQLGHVRDIVNRITTSAYYGAFIAQTIVAQILALYDFMITVLKALITTLFALGLLLSLAYPAVLAFFLPIGAMLGISFCFHPDTLVQTERGVLPLKHLVLGDVLQGGSVVESLFLFECGERQTLYEYRDVIVSGDHLVLHNGTWMYVKETGCPEYKGRRPKHLVTLNTSDCRVRIGDVTFADFEETNDPKAVQEIEERLWGKPIHATYPVGLHPHTLVEKNGKLVPLSTIKLGDQLSCGRVEGIVLIDCKDIVWYDIDGCIVSGNQPVHMNKSYPAKYVGRPISISPPKHAMQIFISNESGWFAIHNKIFVRDYPDSHDEECLEDIQDIVLKALNKRE